jgi:hypothetical protein
VEDLSDVIGFGLVNHPSAVRIDAIAEAGAATRLARQHHP